MKKLIWIAFLTGWSLLSRAQFSVKYDSSIQPVTGMQYFKPVGNNLFVGDCMPFFKDGTYYLYWLLDSAHHSALHGLGGHQWVLSTTTDLKHWVQHPIVLGINEDWEKSICTGSIVYTNNKFYAFYATRLIENGKVNEQLSYAVSNDGIHFQKQKPNPFYTSAPGYSKRNFRDPKVSVDSGNLFHLFIASQQDSAIGSGLEGCLVHLASRDLKTWQVRDPIITGQPSVPECPDYFHWKGWYYLLYSDNSNTFYLKSKFPYGPWEEPANQVFNEDFSNVVKTAAFVQGRRIAASWIPSRLDNKDNNHEVFGGNILLREVKQLTDGSLATSFPPEMVPASGKALPFHPVIDDKTQWIRGSSSLTINAPNGVGTARFENMPENVRIRMEIEPDGNNEEYGLYLRSSEKLTDGYKLSLQADNRTVGLGNSHINGVDGLHKPIYLDIIMKNSIIDVCIDNRRCIVNRVPEQKGNIVWLFCKHGKVKFKNVNIAPLIAE